MKSSPCLFPIVVAGLAGCGSGDTPGGPDGGLGVGDDEAIVRYVEVARPVSGATVLISNTAGTIVDEIETDSEGLAHIALQEPLFATVLRTTAATRSMPAVSPRAVTIQVEPGFAITVGSMEPEFDTTSAGNLDVASDYPEGSMTGLWFDAAIGDAVPESGGGSAFLVVPVGALGESPVVLVATHVDGNGEGGNETAEYALAPDVDLGPLADGADSIQIDLPAWRTDLDDLEVTVSGFDASEYVSVGGRLYAGDVVPGASSYRVFGDSRGADRLEDPETFALRYPPGLGDHLVVRATSYSAETCCWRRSVTADLAAPISDWDIELAPQIPATPSKPEAEYDFMLIKSVSWTNGDGATADGIHLRVRGGWDILLPADAVGWQFPLLPGEHAALSDDDSFYVEVFSIAGSGFDGYAGLIEAFTNMAIDTPPVGETVAVASDSDE